MIESVLNIIPAVMGLGIIDKNLNGLLEAMNNMSPQLHLPNLMWYAKTIGLCLALGVGANECYQMMLGKRGMDVMKLIHIVIISICISAAGTIASLARSPGMLMEGMVKETAMSMNESIEEKEHDVAQLQEDYLEDVRKAMRQMEQAQEAANDANRSDWDLVGRMTDTLDEGLDHLGNILKEYTLVAETKICEWISLVIRLVGEVLLQAIIYGLLVAQRIFMHLLEMVAPLMFAISLSPHFKSAWSQWLSKYISISLWGFVTYVCIYYVFFIIDYNLDQDIAAYEKLQENITGADAQVAAIGMQALGSTCMYIVGLLVGVKVLSMVPEAASWLIPGGVSSSAGSAAAGMVTAGAAMAGGAAMAAGGAAGSMTLGAVSAAAKMPHNLAMKAAEVSGTMLHGGEGGKGTSLISAIAQNTSYGKAYNAGRKRGQDGAPVDTARPATYNEMKNAKPSSNR